MYAGEWGYFQIRVTNAVKPLTVTVTAFGGDPNLFMVSMIRGDQEIRIWVDFDI